MSQVTIPIDPRVAALLHESVYEQLHIAADELSHFAADVTYGGASTIDTPDELRAARRRVVSLAVVAEQFDGANGEAPTQVTTTPELAEHIVASAIEGLRGDLVWLEELRKPQELRRIAEELDVLQATLDELGTGTVAA